MIIHHPLCPPARRSRPADALTESRRALTIGLKVKWVAGGLQCHPAVGGMSQRGWELSFLSVALLMGLPLGTFWVIQPRELEGEKSKTV